MSTLIDIQETGDFIFTVNKAGDLRAFAVDPHGDMVEVDALAATRGEVAFLRQKKGDR